MTLNIHWTSHLLNSPLEKKSLEDTIYNSTLVLNRLKDILEEKERALLTKAHSSSSFQSPSWAFEQAYTNGKLQELTELKQLLTF